MLDAESFTRTLRGQWHGHYGIAYCPAHKNTRTPALSLSNGADGRLLVFCHAGCGFSAVMDAIHRLRLVNEPWQYAFSCKTELRGAHEAERREAMKKAKQALAIWNEASPIQDTSAATYLRASRGINCDMPNGLRYHRECWHGPTARRLPAMIARVDGVAGFAVHRTYLRPDGLGKADVPMGTEKLMLGACAGGHVAIANAEGPLVVAEGIETALSLACGLLNGQASIWAALSTSGMSGLHLPDIPGCLTIATDGEHAGRTAGLKLADRAAALGWVVSLLPAPDGYDWNDVLTKEGALQ